VKRVELAPANSLWADLSVSVKTPFLDVLAAEYGSGMYRVNFAGQPDASRVAINDWVLGRTHDRIKDLLMPGNVSGTTRFVLVNALYFYANWSQLFVKTATATATFHTLAGSDVSVDTMHQTEYLQYKTTSSYDVLQIPYVGNELAMVVVLPQAGQFDATRTQLSAQWVQDNRSGLVSTYVELSLPKFKIETGQMGLTDMLASMGMQLAFTEQADFSGMTDLKPLFISDVIQKAFIGVDEAGTEAAAATAVIMDTVSIKPTPVPFAVDRPFLFYIQDKTGLVLFAGQVVDPTAS
jgi:serpin B